MITVEKMDVDNLVEALNAMREGVMANEEELSTISLDEKVEIKAALDEFADTIRFLLPPGKPCTHCNGSGVEAET